MAGGRSCTCRKDGLAANRTRALLWTRSGRRRGSRAAQDWALARAARRVKAPTILWEEVPPFPSRASRTPDETGGEDALKAAE